MPDVNDTQKQTATDTAALAAAATAVMADLQATEPVTGKGFIAINPSLDDRIAVIEEALKRHGIA